MGKTYRGQDRESFRKKNKKFKRADRDEKQNKRSLANSEDEKDAHPQRSNQS